MKFSLSAVVMVALVMSKHVAFGEEARALKESESSKESKSNKGPKGTKKGKSGPKEQLKESKSSKELKSNKGPKGKKKGKSGPKEQKCDVAITGPPKGTNICEGKKPDGFDNVVCKVDGEVSALEQAGANVTVGYTGNIDTDAIPITTPYFEAGLCPVNVHWHLGTEHLSVGQYDESGTGPSEIHNRRKLSGKARKGFQCNDYNKDDEKFTKHYNWEHCEDMEVGQTYEVHWPHSKAGACGTVNQYQTPFVDGVFCIDGVIGGTGGATYESIGVQAQVFTVVNDESYYYPDLIRGMIVDGAIGSEITKYTGSTTGTSRNNTVCSKYTPITWQVDRNCNIISASSFDKMCRDMKAQRDDMAKDLYPHGSRELVDDDLTADNHINLRKKN